MSKNENTAPDVYKIWDGEQIPFYKENNVKEVEEIHWGILCVLNVVEPTLTVYRAKRKNLGISTIILPGGGYELEGINLEGHNVAKALANQGITSAVLKYRLPNKLTSDRPELVPLQDTRRAIKLLRQLAEKYGIHKKVGLVGFSAGGHLATVTGLWECTDAAEKPDFLALIYGITDLDRRNLKWLEECLYFRKLSDDELNQNRLLDLVTNETPPTFLAHAYNDDNSNVKETTLFAQKLFEHNIPVETHLFSKGGHGFGIGRKLDGTNQWVRLFVNWLRNTIW